MSKEVAKKDSAVKKKRGLHPIKFFKEVITELKKVTWPTRKDLISYTGAVVVFVIIASVLVGALDFVFLQGMQLIVK